MCKAGIRDNYSFQWQLISCNTSILGATKGCSVQGREKGWGLNIVSEECVREKERDGEREGGRSNDGGMDRNSHK